MKIKNIKKYPYGGDYSSDVNREKSKGLSNKKLNPKEWDAQNIQLGYQPSGFGTNSYKEYYNPKEYFKDENGGFMKIADKGKIVNYQNDPSYKPTIKYIEPTIIPNNITKEIPTILDPMKQIGFNGMQKPIIEKYPNGGLNKALDFTKNLGRFAADNALSTIGMDNVINQDSYQGAGANDFAKASNITGGINKAMLPIGAGAAGFILGGPQGAQVGYMAGKGLQGLAGNYNPNDAGGGSTDYMKTQGNANQIGQVGDTVGKIGMTAMGSGLFANGGVQYTNGGNGQINGEVEKEENSIAPDGTFTQFSGSSHENGGIKTDLQSGELIFSDRLKPKGSKKTFADLNKKFNTNKEDKLAEDKKSNNIQKLTAQLMKEAKMKQSMALFQEQESLKQEKVTNYAKRMGISPDKFSFGGIKKLPKFDPGGVFGDNDPALADDFGFTYDDKPNMDNSAEIQNNQANFDLYSPEDQAALMGGNDNYTSSPVEGVQSSDYSPQQSNSSPYGNILKQAALGIGQNMGNIYDLKRSQTVDNEKYNRVSPELLDPSASLKYNDLQGKLANENIKNASVGNASTYLNNRKDLAINQMLTNNRITQDYANQNAAIKNNANYYNAGVGDRETVANLQNQAQSRNLKASAYTNIGQNIMGQYKDVQSEKANNKYNQNMTNSQNDYLKIIAAKYPEIMNDPEMAKLFK